MSATKTMIAVAATAFAALAFAQGTPPQPGAADPAVGAGQRSTQETPMGTTGTPGGGATGSVSSGATMSDSASGSTAGSTMSSDSSTSGSGSSMSGSTTMRTARADRN